MAATPPRPASPVSRPTVSIVVPKPTHPLQISPNLEALLQHDELTRRCTSSPTTASSAFPISLPPPPPRKAQGSRKPGQREQEPFHTTRSKEEKRKRTAVLGSDCWPDALPTTLPPDGHTAGQSPKASSSRPVTPNPYLNPTPELRRINTPPGHADDDSDPPTPRPAEKSIVVMELKSESPRSAAGPASTPDPSHRHLAASNKVERMRWMGRDSLSLFSTCAKNNNFRRPDSDRRHERAEWCDMDAVQGNLFFSSPGVDGQMRQVSVPPAQCPSRSGEDDTATVALSRSDSPYPVYLQQPVKVEPLFETTSARSSISVNSESSPTKEQSPVLPHPSAFLPRLSLPSIFSSPSHNSPSRSQLVDDDITRDYLSFIDFCSPSMSDDPVQDSAKDIIAPRPQLDSISVLSRRDSCISLASMRFAPPPSPTGPTMQHPSPTYARSESSSSSVTLSSMKFAPPSPSTGRISPTRLQPLSEPPSPYSPLEFAAPPSPLFVVTENPYLSATPAFVSDHAGRLAPKKRSMSSSPRVPHHPRSPLPPTTNQLDANERADRIRRNRKLARVFGRMPGADKAGTTLEESRTSKKLHSLLTKPKNHRHAVSVSVSVKASGMKTEPSTPWQTDRLWSPSGRRHSTPLATGPFTLYADDENRTIVRDAPDSVKCMDSDTLSARSFIDLSDEDVRDDDVSSITFLTPHQVQRHLHHSNSFPSLVESLDSEAQAEAERRRKREKLARLHRFLGSRVPPEAVNGCAIGPPLPPLAAAEQADNEYRLRGAKYTPLEEFDRGTDELDEKEKALNVRRAQKMERVFGTQPPQKLFHTRPTRPIVPSSHPASPTSLKPFVLTLDIPSTSSRNQNQSAYMGKTKIPLHPGASESSRCLLHRADDTPDSSPFADSFTDSPGFQQVLAQSSVYLNYQHSLNSLIDIIDRDDRKSLVELHRFLHGEVGGPPSDDEVQVNSRRSSIAASLKSERRHSLPSRASMTSLSSEFISPQISRFQIRRRKAAKLTHFFGVDYRELIQDILESIEKGVEEERKEGTLQPQEVEVLMHRVRSLRSINSNM